MPMKIDAKLGLDVFKLDKEPHIVIDTEVLGLHRSKPEYSTFRSSSVAMLTPELPTLP